VSFTEYAWPLKVNGLYPTGMSRAVSERGVLNLLLLNQRQYSES
jgi:hypothetical protein